MNKCVHQMQLVGSVCEVAPIVWQCVPVASSWICWSFRNRESTVQLQSHPWLLVSMLPEGWGKENKFATHGMKRHWEPLSSPQLWSSCGVWLFASPLSRCQCQSLGSQVREVSTNVAQAAQSIPERMQATELTGFLNCASCTQVLVAKTEHEQELKWYDEEHVLHLWCEGHHGQKGFIGVAPVGVHCDPKPNCHIVDEAIEVMVCFAHVENRSWIKMSADFHDDLSRHCKQLKKIGHLHKYKVMFWCSRIHLYMSQAVDSHRIICTHRVNLFTWSTNHLVKQKMKL